MPTPPEPDPAPQPLTDALPSASAGAVRQRIVGVDLARGLAIVGMFAAHILTTPDLGWAPSTWSAIVHGRSSILFATLAGVSIGLVSGGPRPAGEVELAQVRVRVIVRAVLLFALGGALQTFGYVAVILEVYAVLTVLTLPFLRWRARSLFVLAGVLAVVTPPVTFWLDSFDWSTTPGIVSIAVSGHYPAIIWSTFVVLGLGIGRTELRSTRVAVALIGAGAALAVGGYCFGWLSTQAVSSAHPDGIAVRLAGAGPHSGAPGEVIGSAGVAMLVLGLCLLVPPLAQRALRPLSAAGSMALTLYAAHIPFLTLLREFREQSPEAAYAVFVAVALAFAWGWQRWVGGKGPLERLFAWVVRRTTTPRVPGGRE